MLSPTLWLKLSLPLAFFGYAVAANLALYLGAGLKLTETDLARGGLTAEIDSVYRAELPHKDPSVGVIGALRFALLSEGREGVVVGDASWLYSSEEFRFVDAAPTTLTDTVSGMADIAATWAARGTDLVVVPLPTKLEIEAGQAPDRAAVLRSAAEYDAFLAALTEAGLDHVDTRAAFASGDAFYQTDTHWTPDTAQNVARAVAASGLVALGDAGFDRVEGAAVRFHGDLVTFITSDRLAPLVGLAAEEVTPWVAEPVQAADAALDLFGADEAAQVVLVGTSYSANPNWSFGEALKTALSRDVLNLAQEGRGPMAPMLDALADAALDPAPEVILWEVPVRYLADPALWPKDKAMEVPDA